jgi:hypothetical protein
MPLDGTLGYLVGKLDILRVECATCGRYLACETRIVTRKNTRFHDAPFRLGIRLPIR